MVPFLTRLKNVDYSTGFFVKFLIKFFITFFHFLLFNVCVGGRAPLQCCV